MKSIFLFILICLTTGCNMQNHQSISSIAIVSNKESQINWEPEFTRINNFVENDNEVFVKGYLLTKQNEQEFFENFKDAKERLNRFKDIVLTQNGELQSFTEEFLEDNGESFLYLAVVNRNDEMNKPALQGFLCFIHDKIFFEMTIISNKQIEESKKEQAQSIKNKLLSIYHSNIENIKDMVYNMKKKESL